MRLLISVFILFVFSLNTYSQDDERLIQFSGLTITSDSLSSIPYVNILIKNIHRGTVSDYRGFFSLVANPGDTVIFSHLAFKESIFVIPKNLTETKYSVIQLMTIDTVFLSETVIYPWPTPEQFRQAFLSLNIPDDELERARKNLEKQRLKELGDAMVMDANENKDYYLRQQAAKFYYKGQTPPMNIFNPLAWAEFFKAWQRGDFKRKD